MSEVQHQYVSIRWCVSSLEDAKIGNSKDPSVSYAALTMRRCAQKKAGVLYASLRPCGATT